MSDTIDVPIEPTEGETTERLVHEPYITPKGCNHYFVRESSEEVKCRNCKIGLFVNPTDRIDDGKLIHIY